MILLVVILWTHEDNTQAAQNADKAKMILETTQKKLGQNLRRALKKHKTLGAVSFCNTKAISLTKEVMQKYNVEIKRATDRPRNKNNQANNEELHYIKQFKEQILSSSSKLKLKPITVKKGKRTHFYAPIVTNQMCMQCHGIEKDEIKPETLAKINELYPGDQARGYRPNQLRGIFSISWQD